MKLNKLCSCLIVGLASVVFINGCGQGSDVASMEKAAIRFGSAMDGKRQALKILPIPANAISLVRTPTSLEWISQDSAAVHKAKKIIYKADLSTIESEIDLLVRTSQSPQANAEDNGVACDTLEITTVYSSDGGAVTSQTALLTIAGKEQKKLTSAEEIAKRLQEWNAH